MVTHADTLGAGRLAAHRTLHTDDPRRFDKLSTPVSPDARPDPLPRRDRELDELANAEVVAPGVAPCAVLGVAVHDGVRWHAAFGAAGHAGTRQATLETPFDLASVTKPFVAATAAALARRGLLSLDDPLTTPGLSATGAVAEPGPSLAQLLSHRAGLEAHRRLYAPLEEKRPFEKARAIATALSSRRAECRDVPPGSDCPPLYSDLGYLLAGETLAASARLDLDTLVAREVTAPLELRVGSARQWLRAAPSFSVDAAPTENVTFRGGLLRGVVHDENAWALAGHGIAGHAGLFGTAPAVARFGMALLDALAGRQRGWLDTAAVRRMVEPREGGTLRMGFDGKSATGSAAGDVASSDSFGHLGFTGTSLWCDPRLGRVSVLLTNRVCPTRAHTAIRAARPRVHDALVRHALGG